MSRATSGLAAMESRPLGGAEPAKPEIREPAAIKVLRAIYDLQVGGVQRMLYRSIAPLRAAGIDLEVVCLKELGEMTERFRAEKVPVHLVPFGSRLDPAGLWKLHRVIGKGGYDLVHSQMYAANAAVNLAAFGTGVPIVNSYHSQTPFSGASQRRMARWTRGRPRRIVAVSGSVAEGVALAGIAREKISIIYNGVGVPEAPQPAVVRAEGEPLRAFWAGRYVKQKRVEMLIDIAAACRRVGVSMHLTLVGDGPQRDKIQRRVGELGIGDVVTFVEFQADINPIIAEQDVYVSASDREGFPNTLLEVMAQGRGALLSDIQPNAEVAGESGGLKLLGDDVEEWVNWLRVLSADRKWIATMGTAAWTRAKEFSVERTCRDLAKLYQDVVAEVGG